MKGYGRFRVMESDDLIIRVYEHTDDPKRDPVVPKRDPVVTFLCECKEEKYADTIAIALENECSGLRRGQSPQREDVIDREAIARIIDPDAFNATTTKHWTSSWIIKRQREARERADAIARSLPSREAIIEEAVISELFRASDNAVIAHNTVHELKPYISKALRSLAAQPRSNSVEDGADE